MAVAEEALKHVRLVAFVEEDGLFGEVRLKGVRKEEFWIIFGGCVTDRAVMKGNL